MTLNDLERLLVALSSVYVYCDQIASFLCKVALYLSFQHGKFDCKIRMRSTRMEGSK